ncbi:MAG: hypothetical protein JXR88_14480 [Clostridia bacterium]|nr:hypothetical protein [Clostridia bacterium]
MDLKKLISDIGEKFSLNLSQKNKYGDNKIEGNQFAEKIVNMNFDPNNSLHIQELIELTKTGVKPEIKEKILPIEKMITEGNNLLAMEKYLSLFNSDEFNYYSSNEKFLVYNGILNCNVNHNSDDSEIEKWSIKIESLGEVEDIHKYYYIKAIWKYNKGDLKVAKALNSKAIAIDSDYINALSFEMLIKARLNEVSYEEAKEVLSNILKGDLSAKDFSRTYGILADISIMNDKFQESLKYYTESNDYVKGFGKELGIAISLYHLSIKEVRPDGMVDFQNIEFETLRKSQRILEKIYDERPEDYIGHTANVHITYLFNIYSLTGKFDRTLKIINEVKDVLDLKNPEISRLVVQAQVINKIYDEEVFEYLSEYDVIKYKSFYLELMEEYEQVYEMLLPAIEGKYFTDKLLRLSFLNCLKNLDNFGDYIKYYKKFQKAEVEEALLMNFIEYLEELGKQDEMYAGLMRLKSCLRNPFIAVAYMKTLKRHDYFDDLDEFYDNVDKGIYPIIEDNISMVTYDRLMSYLRREDYPRFYEAYEQLDLSKLKEAEKLILTVNYYNAKGDYPNCGKAYFELYKVEKKPDDLMKAIQNMIMANNIPVAEMYLEYVNPMELKQPELYYMYSAMALRERKKLPEAFEKLNEYKDFVDDLESPFHQFYFGFNMNNGRTDEAMRYIGKYYEKNPNPNWFKVVTTKDIQEYGDILKHLKNITGPTPDYDEINKFYSSGIMGVSLYSKLVGRRFEDVLNDDRYPLSKLNLTNENVEISIEKAEAIGDSLIVDANTLTILARVNGLGLLNVFEKLYINQDTYSKLKELEREFIKNSSTTILEYIDTSMNVEILPVDVTLKDTSEKAKLLPEDTMSSLVLSEKMGIAFLNVETSLEREFKPNHVVNINSLFFKLKKSNPELHEKMALVKRDLRLARYNFISFEAVDIISVYKSEGIDGIKPFVRLDKGSIYSTYLPQYMTVLIELEKEIEKSDFEELLSFFIRFIDKYLGKSKSYLSNLGRRFVTLKFDTDNVIRHCNLRTIFWFLRKANLSEVRLNMFSQFVGSHDTIEELVVTHNFIVKHDKDNNLHELRKQTYERIQTLEYVDALRNDDYIKVSQILSFVAQFFTQVMSAFGKTEEDSKIIMKILEDNLVLNSMDDIEYLSQLINEITEKNNE